MQNLTYRVLEISHYYRSYDVMRTCIYTFCTVVLLSFVIIVIAYVRLQRRLNYFRFAKKSELYQGIFLFNAWMGTGTSYARAKAIFKIQMFILITFTNLAAQKASKQRMTKYHPQKSLSNNARSVVKSLAP